MQRLTIIGGIVLLHLRSCLGRARAVPGHTDSSSTLTKYEISMENIVILDAPNCCSTMLQVMLMAWKGSPGIMRLSSAKAVMLASAFQVSTQ